MFDVWEWEGGEGEEESVVDEGAEEEGVVRVWGVGCGVWGKGRWRWGMGVREGRGWVYIAWLARTGSHCSPLRCGDIAAGSRFRQASLYDIDLVWWYLDAHTTGGGSIQELGGAFACCGGAFEVLITRQGLVDRGGGGVSDGVKVGCWARWNWKNAGRRKGCARGLEKFRCQDFGGTNRDGYPVISFLVSFSILSTVQKNACDGYLHTIANSHPL